MNKKERKAFFKKMSKLAPPKHLIPTNGPSKTHTIKNYTVILGDVSSIMTDDTCQVSIVYKKLDKYEPMLLRGKHIVTIKMDDDEFDAEMKGLNEAMSKYVNFYE